ncbi:hypothetical protein [Micromonospora echinofusca]|uniref:Uncharacterized protein n=1 Tax=Micromonospora echinofusca TaxID=47858 RepID=A0ABS3VN74_MICEH|nr:hypothetical protein [Micromonospora echinofusca]MBO4205903.1 hypothetical protein [Micromonospora echinofusca]
MTVDARSRSFLTNLNEGWHRRALAVYMVIVVAHWGEHITQAVQIWGLGWTPAEARGVLGMPFPWLVQQEWMHYAYALVMLVGLVILRRGFVGSAATWWGISLAIQVWHHFEHLLLLIQSLTGYHLQGRPVPTSIVQFIVPRVELHLLYNALVFLPMVVAMYLHMRPTPAVAARMRCTCHGVRPTVSVA